MSNYRTHNTLLFTAGQSGNLDRAWGVLPGTGSAGTITLEGFGSGSGLYPNDQRATINISHLQAGIPFPCYIRSISVTAGSVYVLG